MLIKTILIVTAFSIAFLSTKAVGRNSPCADDGKGIAFVETSWEEALALAEKEQKLIFLDAYAKWCGPCKLMSRKVFSGTKVGELFNDNFINVKIDMEKGEGPALAEKYDVTVYPSLFFLDHTGKVTKKAVGYHDTKQLIELGKKALKQ